MSVSGKIDKRLKGIVFNIYGQKIPCRPVKNMAQTTGDIGRFYYVENEIVFDPDIEPLHTLLHEFIHAMAHRLSWNQFLEKQAEEMLADTIALALMENFEIKPRKVRKS